VLVPLPSPYPSLFRSDLSQRDRSTLAAFGHVGVTDSVVYRSLSPADSEESAVNITPTKSRKLSEPQAGQCQEHEDRGVVLCRARSEEHTSELQSRFDL